MQLKFYSPFFILLLSAVITSCAVNPVTGRNEISLVSETQERAIGEQQYGPSQQSQGGEFTVDHPRAFCISTYSINFASSS